MIAQKELPEYLKNNKAFFKENFNIEEIGVFGSYARGEQTEHSDIDIIIEMPKGTEDIFEKRLMLKQRISEYFSKPVDVCIKRAIKPVFKDLILKDVIYV